MLWFIFVHYFFKCVMLQTNFYIEDSDNLFSSLVGLSFDCKTLIIVVGSKVVWLTGCTFLEEESVGILFPGCILSLALPKKNVIGLKK